jgi:glycosyltransferase involved in cell wall biosynthesis
MKLILVISSMATGGAERVLSILATSWAKRGWQVTLVTTHDDGSPSFYALDPGVKLEPILLANIPGGGGWPNVRRVMALRQIIKEQSPDVVVSFLNFTNILTLLASGGLDVPVVVSERLDPRVHKLNRAWTILRRLLYPKAMVLVNQTEAAANWFRSWMGQKICVVANPVLEPRFQDGPAELDLPPSSLVAMGRLHHQKGFDTLLKAMAIVHTGAPDLHLTVLGEGPLRQNLEILRDELGLQGVVDFPGRVKRPHDVLKQAELFILSSVTEGFPNVLCEAMAVGLPVVSTNCPSGPDEIINSGKNGLLVPVGEAKALAEAILSLMADSETRKMMGESASEVVHRFSLAKVLEDWDEVLRKAGLSV